MSLSLFIETDVVRFYPCDWCAFFVHRHLFSTTKHTILAATNSSTDGGTVVAPLICRKIWHNYDSFLWVAIICLFFFEPSQRLIYFDSIFIIYSFSSRSHKVRWCFFTESPTFTAKRTFEKKERKTSCYYCFGKKNENARYPFAVAPIQGVARGPWWSFNPVRFLQVFFSFFFFSFFFFLYLPCWYHLGELGTFVGMLQPCQ